MCTILLAWRCLAGTEFVLAANRDELVDRPSAPPGLLHTQPPIFGGHDLLAGGTWLAVTPDGRLAAVTNRPGDKGDEVRRDPGRRSRGELPVALLRNLDGEVPDWLGRLRPADYNPFNILALSASAAVAGHGRDTESLDVVSLEPGAHLLCVHDVDDAAHDKERRLRRRLEAAISDSAGEVAECMRLMTAMLGDHETNGGDPRDATCIHGEEYGTVSASLVALSDAGRLVYRHAPGRPCTTAFDDVDLTAG